MWSRNSFLHRIVSSAGKGLILLFAACMCASAQSSVTVFPSSLSFMVEQNSAASPEDQSILVNGSSAGTYAATVSPGADWLVIRPTSNLTVPGLLTVGVQSFS